jgi:hypothetical protein
MSKYYYILENFKIDSFKIIIIIKSIDDNLVQTSKYFKGIIKDN